RRPIVVVVGGTSMHHLIGTRNRWMLWPAILLLVCMLLNGQGMLTDARHAGADTNVTLSVYTCCGSLAGFDDTNAADLASVHSIYGGLWSKMYPTLRWRETTFDDPATLA